MANDLLRQRIALLQREREMEDREEAEERDVLNRLALFEAQRDAQIGAEQRATGRDDELAERRRILNANQLNEMARQRIGTVQSLMGGPNDPRNFLERRRADVVPIDVSRGTGTFESRDLPEQQISPEVEERARAIREARKSAPFQSELSNLRKVEAERIAEEGRTKRTEAQTAATDRRTKAVSEQASLDREQRAIERKQRADEAASKRKVAAEHNRQKVFAEKAKSIKGKADREGNFPQLEKNMRGFQARLGDIDVKPIRGKGRDKEKRSKIERKLKQLDQWAGTAAYIPGVNYGEYNKKRAALETQLGKLKPAPGGRNLTSQAATAKVPTAPPGVSKEALDINTVEEAIAYNNSGRGTRADAEYFDQKFPTGPKPTFDLKTKMVSNLPQTSGGATLTAPPPQSLPQQAAQPPLNPTLIPSHSRPAAFAQEGLPNEFIPSRPPPITAMPTTSMVPGGTDSSFRSAPPPHTINPPAGRPATILPAEGRNMIGDLDFSPISPGEIESPGEVGMAAKFHLDSLAERFRLDPPTEEQRSAYLDLKNKYWELYRVWR